MEKRLANPERLSFLESLLMKFKKGIENLCKKASFKLHVLHKIRKFPAIERARTLANAFINSQFNYAPLIWMFVSKTALHKILKTYYRTLQVVYSKYQKPYEELLQINKDISIHQKHLRILALEVYKSSLTQNLCGIVLIQTPFLIT